MAKIILERQKCIGCGSCEALCPNYWKMQEDGKISLLESKENPETGNQEREIENIGCNQTAAEACPVQCIHIVKS